jgi:hypothetical protein
MWQAVLIFHTKFNDVKRLDKKSFIPHRKRRNNPPALSVLFRHPYHMKTTLIFAVATLLLLASCGPSEQEKIAQLQVQKAKNDSLRIAGIQSLKDAKLLRAALSDSLAAYTTLLDHQQKELIKLRTTLLAANDDLTELKQSNSGRTQQVQNQELKIQSFVVQQITLVSSMEHSQAQIAQIKSQLTTTASR